MKIIRTIFLTLCMVWLSLSVTAAQSTSSDSLAVPDSFEAFNFWIGEWDVYRYGTDQLVGKNSISSINGGRTLMEVYHSTTSNYEGRSLNMYHVQKNQWEQFWTDNSGIVLHIVGNRVGDHMIMVDANSRVSTTNPQNRIDWHHISDEEVRQTWSQSTDGGQTWIVVFDGLYKRKDS